MKLWQKPREENIQLLQMVSAWYVEGWCPEYESNIGLRPPWITAAVSLARTMHHLVRTREAFSLVQDAVHS